MGQITLSAEGHFLSWTTTKEFEHAPFASPSVINSGLWYTLEKGSVLNGFLYRGIRVENLNSSFIIIPSSKVAG